MMDVTMPGDDPKTIEREERLPEPPPGFVSTDTRCMIYDPELGQVVVYKLMHIDGTETILRPDLAEKLKKHGNQEPTITEGDEEMAKRKWPSDEALIKQYQECNEDIKALAKQLDRPVAYVRNYLRRAQKAQKNLEAFLKEGTPSAEPQPEAEPVTPAAEQIAEPDPEVQPQAPQVEDKPADETQSMADPHMTPPKHVVPEIQAQPDPFNGLTARLEKVEVYIAKERPMLLEQVGQLREQVSGLKLQINALGNQPVPKVALLERVGNSKVEVIAELIAALLENESLRRENREIKALVRQGITPRYSEGEADE